MTTTRVPCKGQTDPCEPKNVAEHVHCVARHSEKSAEEIAVDIRKGYDWYIKRTSGANPCDAPVWLMKALARETGRTDHVEALAREVGLVCYRLPKGEARTDRQIADLLREFGESITAFADHFSKGRRSLDDVARVVKEWRDVVNTGEAIINTITEQDPLPFPQAVAR